MKSIWRIPAAIVFVAGDLFCASSSHAERLNCESLSLEIAADAGIAYERALVDIKQSIEANSDLCTVKAVLLSDIDHAYLPVSEIDKLSSSNQGYRIELYGSAAFVLSTSSAGLLVGLSQLQNLVESGPVPDTTMLEVPAIESRILHFVMRSVGYNDFIRLIGLARRARFNSLVVQIADAVAFESYPGTVRKDALSKSQFIALVRLARQNGLDVIPEIKLLTHQEKFFQDKYPELMFNKVTYDPNIPRVYDLIDTYIDELVTAIQPEYVHIGHDEVKGFGNAAKSKWLAPDELPLPAPLFLQDSLELHRIIVSKGVKVMMWGDMLLDRPFVHETFQRNWAERSGYAGIVEKLPKDIVIVDWRYFDKGPDYPSITNLSRTGMTVYGATWDDLVAVRKFSGYMARRGAIGSGMFATTWNAVQRKEWDRIESIIAESGQAFWNGH